MTEKNTSELLYLSRLKALFSWLNENTGIVTLDPSIVFNPKPYKVGEVQHLDVKGFPHSQTVCINNMCRTPEDGLDCPEFEIFIFWETDDPRGATSFNVDEGGTLTRNYHEYFDIPKIEEDAYFSEEGQPRYRTVTTKIPATEEDSKLVSDILSYIETITIEK